MPTPVERIFYAFQSGVVTHTSRLQLRVPHPRRRPDICVPSSAPTHRGVAIALLAAASARGRAMDSSSRSGSSTRRRAGNHRLAVALSKSSESTHLGNCCCGWSAALHLPRPTPPGFYRVPAFARERREGAQHVRMPAISKLLSNAPTRCPRGHPLRPERSVICPSTEMVRRGFRRGHQWAIGRRAGPHITSWCFSLWRVEEDGGFEWLHPHPQRRVGQNESADGNNW